MTKKRRAESPESQSIRKAGAMTEAELREREPPHPKTKDELVSVIGSLVDRPHDYGTCVYAISLSAAAAFNYAASVLGASGFQASCADLDILRLTRGLDDFMILKAEDLLYPQYDPMGQAAKFLKDARPRLAGKARQLLRDPAGVHPQVLARWSELARARGGSR
jgi:hypothetical protein